MAEHLPSIRHTIQPIPVTHEGKQMVLLLDAAGESPHRLLVSPEVFLVAQLLDGTRDALDVQAEYLRQAGTMLFTETLQQITGSLNEALFLKSPTYEEHSRKLREKRAREEEEFRNSPTRKAKLAGQGYPAEAEELRSFLKSFFTDPRGPGLAGDERAGKCRAVVVPHIDLRRGGTTYARAYKALAESEGPELFVVLGVAHAGGEVLFTLTEKDFETPLGLIETDKEAVDALKEAGDGDELFAEEFTHRDEHSVEFQALFLRYIFGERARMVPVLCGSFHKFFIEDKDPMEEGRVRNFVEALTEVAQTRRACLIASADLSHVGYRFGHAQPLTPELLGKVEEEDREMLAHVEGLDGGAFFSHVAREKDRRNICGFVPIYLLLQASGAESCEFLEYAQSPEEETQSVVSYASLVLR